MTPLKQFLQEIYKHTPDPDNLMVAWGGVSSPIYPTVSELLGLVENPPQDRDVFFTPAVLHRTPRESSAVAGSSVAWVDRDTYKADVKPLLPPSIVVNSGRGQHYYYLLADYTGNLDLLVTANRALEDHLGLRHEASDRARLLRVPGSNNCKHLKPDGPEKGYDGPLPCAIIEFHPERVYDLEDIARLQQYPSDLLTTPLTDGDKLDQSRRDWNLAKRLAGWGIQRYAVELALLYHSDKARKRDAYLQATLDKVYEALAKSTQAKQPQPLNPSGNNGNNDDLLNAALVAEAMLVDQYGREKGIMMRVTWPGNSLLAAATALDFKSATSVITWLQEYTGNRTFTGSDRQAKLLFSNLVATCPKRRVLQVTQAGRHELPDGQRVFIYDNNQAILLKEDEDLGVYWQPTINAGVRLDLKPGGLAPLERAELIRQVLQVNVPGIIQPALGWLMATPLTPVFEEMKARTPVLLLYGYPGSGKTSLIERVLLPLLGAYFKGSSSDSTTFAVIGAISQSWGWPAWFAEYRSSNYHNNTFLKLLREQYDQMAQMRGRPDLTLSHHHAVAPIIMDGENPFPDGANAERAIALQLEKNTVDMGGQYELAYQKVMSASRDTFSRFAYDYIQWTLTIDRPKLKRLLDEAIERFRGISTTPRIIANIAICWVGFELLKEFLGPDAHIEADDEVFKAAILGIHRPGLGVRNNADALVEQVTFSFLEGRVLGEWDPAGDVLWFSLTSALKSLNWAMDPNQIRIQLRQRTDAYLVGPERRRGGAEYWGINIGSTHELGLDTYRPSGSEIGVVNGQHHLHYNGSGQEI
jgi:hypothetical protein